MNDRLDITGVILVGGKSRRMGKDKAFLEFSGKSLFERVLELHRESFQQVMLVGDPQERFEEELAQLDREGKSFLNINTPEEFDRLEKGSSS